VEADKDGSSKVGRWKSDVGSWLLWLLATLWVASCGWPLIVGSERVITQILGYYLVAASGFLWAVGSEWRFGGVTNLLSRWFDPPTAEDEPHAPPEDEPDAEPAERQPWLLRANQTVQDYEALLKVISTVVVPLAVVVVGAILTSLWSA
jgi:hypothetical protein